AVVPPAPPAAEPPLPVPSSSPDSSPLGSLEPRIPQPLESADVQSSAPARRLRKDQESKCRAKLGPFESDRRRGVPDQQARTLVFTSGFQCGGNDRAGPRPV